LNGNPLHLKMMPRLLSVLHHRPGQVFQQTFTVKGQEFDFEFINDKKWSEAPGFIKCDNMKRKCSSKTFEIHY